MEEPVGEANSIMRLRCKQSLPDGIGHMTGKNIRGVIVLDVY
ncbi:hypothetical protein OVA06_13030 [Pseudarthrobacter sp. SL88]|nr:hypothetical protein [Pseudarthrobacter sp. SL88]MCY1675619.1 hypothetical protein [Pseudarthrobacter sp. SL88]